MGGRGDIMKKYLIIIAFFLILKGTYGQTPQDSLAIIQLLEKEGATWRIGDAKGHAECWAVKSNGPPNNEKEKQRRI